MTDELSKYAMYQGVSVIIEHDTKRALLNIMCESGGRITGCEVNPEEFGVEHIRMLIKQAIDLAHDRYVMSQRLS